MVPRINFKNLFWSRRCPEESFIKAFGEYKRPISKLAVVDKDISEANRFTDVGM